MFVRYHGTNELKVLINDLSVVQAIRSVSIYHDDLKELWQAFCSCFVIIEAAGGWVTNSKEEILFIFRNNRWDLPKGKIEAGESPEIGAVREVEEECGIENISRKALRYTTWHTYKHQGKMVLKRTYWFNMEVHHNPTLTPQLEEGITEVKWIPSGALPSAVTSNTYPSILDVIGTDLS